MTIQVAGAAVSGSLSAAYTSELDYRTETIFWNAETLPDFTMVNAACRWEAVEGRLSVGVRATNMLDSRHREYIVGDYVERRVLAEIRFHIP